MGRVAGFPDSQVAVDGSMYGDGCSQAARFDAFKIALGRISCSVPNGST